MARGEKSSQLNFSFSHEYQKHKKNPNSSKFIYHSKAILSSRKTHTRYISDISDMSLHEKAARILKLSLEKSCTGTGRVMN